MIVLVVFVFNIWLLLFVYVWHCVAFSTICLFAFAWMVVSFILNLFFNPVLFQVCA